jgi:hypothetical protein
MEKDTLGNVFLASYGHGEEITGGHSNGDLIINNEAHMVCLGLYLYFSKMRKKLGAVAYAYNLSYSGGGD